MVKTVDNYCAAAVSHHGTKVSVGFVYVTVNKIPGFPLLKKRIEARKSHMGQVAHIPIAPRGRMGQQDVKAVHQYSKKHRAAAEVSVRQPCLMAMSVVSVLFGFTFSQGVGFSL